MLELDLNFVGERRKELGLSLDEMAKSLGFTSESTYWKYEKGIYKIRAALLPKLAEVLKCPISQFYTRGIAETARRVEKNQEVTP